MSRLRKFSLTALGATAALLALAAPALAHVTVIAPGATSGGSDQEITFRVPVEANVDTVGLTVQMPTDTPIASVLVEPVPGWTHTQTTAKLAKPITTDDGTIAAAVSTITWKADTGSALKPGEFGAFTLIAGQLPDAKQLVFKAIQTYADGSVVKWIETAAPGSTDEPDHPAPVLTLAAASGTDDPQSTTGSESGQSSAPTAQAAPVSSSSSSSSDTGAVVLSIIALAVAVGALGFGFVSRARGRKDTA